MRGSRGKLLRSRRGWWEVGVLTLQGPENGCEDEGRARPWPPGTPGLAARIGEFPVRLRPGLLWSEGSWDPLGGSLFSLGAVKEGFKEEVTLGGSRKTCWVFRGRRTGVNKAQMNVGGSTLRAAQKGGWGHGRGAGACPSQGPTGEGKTCAGICPYWLGSIFQLQDSERARHLPGVAQPASG